MITWPTSLKFLPYITYYIPGNFCRLSLYNTATYRTTPYSLQPTLYQKFTLTASVFGLSNNWLDVRWVAAFFFNDNYLSSRLHSYFAGYRVRVTGYIGGWLVKSSPAF